MELAPYPKKIHSVSHALYRAIEELAGTDYAEDSDVLRRLKEFWEKHEYIGIGSHVTKLMQIKKLLESGLDVSIRIRRSREATRTLHLSVSLNSKRRSKILGKLFERVDPPE